MRIAILRSSGIKRSLGAVPHAWLACSLLAASAACPVHAQTYAQDTLALRIILDENQLDVPLAQVSTVSEGRITAVNLSGRKLVRLPPQVGVLTALRSLALSDNLLDSLPAELWTLSRLSQLDAGGNRIRALDGRVGDLKNLLFLGLRGNALETLPAGLFALDQLEVLLLSGNAIGSIPESVSDLAFLRYLDVSGNLLSGVPFTLAAMDLLDSLDLSLNRLERLPEVLSGMRAETAVKLSGNQLCALSPALQAWATAKDPAWRESQQCGSPVRRQSAGPRAFRLERRADAGGGVSLRLIAPAGLEGNYRVDLRDAGGSLLRSVPVAADPEAWIPLGRLPGYAPLYGLVRGRAGPKLADLGFPVMVR